MKYLAFFLLIVCILLSLPLLASKKEGPKSDAIFLDVFEVKVKKRDLGLQWEEPFFNASQFIAFPPKDNPNSWNADWNRKLKNEEK